MIKRKQSGFSLIELFVGITILSIISYFATAGFAGALNFNAKVETKTRLDAWRIALDKFYFDKAMTIDGDANAQLNLGGAPAVVIPASNPNVVTRTCSINPTDIADIASLAGYAATDFVKDGGNRGFCLLITPRLSQTLNGATLYYHSVAVVSPGKDGVVDTTTTLSATGQLSLAVGSDDTGILFDGRKFSADRYAQTMISINKISSAYDSYYAARYQSDPNRSLSIDYFSCGQAVCPSTLIRHDAGGSMRGTYSILTTGVAMNPATGSKPYETLGLSISDSVNGWGGDIILDNASDAVRSPFNSSAAKQTPPYTAIISTTIPGGTVVSTTSVGQI